MVRSTDRPATTIAVDLGRKANKTKEKKTIKCYNSYLFNGSEQGFLITESGTGTFMLRLCYFMTSFKTYDVTIWPDVALFCTWRMS